MVGAAATISTVATQLKKNSKENFSTQAEEILFLASLSVLKKINIYWASRLDYFSVKSSEPFRKRLNQLVDKKLFSL